MGDRLAHLRHAARRLGAVGKVVAVSPLYETAPVGGPDQGDYLNAVILVDSSLPPRRMLDHCLAVERERGRERKERWAARTLDLDLLVAGNEPIDEPGLTIPHPRLGDRRFVVEPLADVWRGALPDGRRPADLAARLADQRVHRVAGPGWATPAPRRTAAIAVSLVAAGVAAGLARCLLRSR